MKLILLFIALLSVFSCNDEITVYRYKGTTHVDKVEKQVEKGLEVVKPINTYQGGQNKPILVKTCDPPCAAPLTCNSDTGKCEGKASKKSEPTTYNYDYLVLRSGKSEY